MASTQHKGSIAPAIAGAAIGAAGAAAIMAAMNPKTKKQIVHHAKIMKDKAVDMMGQAKSKINDITSFEDPIEEVEQQAKRVTARTVKQAD